MMPPTNSFASLTRLGTCHLKGAAQSLELQTGQSFLLPYEAPWWCWMRAFVWVLFVCLSVCLSWETKPGPSCSSSRMSRLLPGSSSASRVLLQMGRARNTCPEESLIHKAVKTFFFLLSFFLAGENESVHASLQAHKVIHCAYFVSSLSVKTLVDDISLWKRRGLNVTSLNHLHMAWIVNHWQWLFFIGPSDVAVATTVWSTYLANLI